MKVKVALPATGSTDGGETVLVSGSGFVNGFAQRGGSDVSRRTAVRFGAAPATNVNVIDDNRVEVVAPPGAPGSADVAVTNPNGTDTATTGQWERGDPEDTNSNGAKQLGTTVSGFDRPIFGFFSSDNTQAWILNCGPECGGTQASVQVLDLVHNTAGPATPVPGGATVGFLKNQILYVAGNPPVGSNTCAGGPPTAGRTRRTAMPCECRCRSSS